MSDGLEVDVRAVASVGARMVRSAEVLRQQAIDAGRLEFGGVQAGRDYCALVEWATDTEAVGHIFRAGATRYAGTEGAFADGLDRVLP
jgi:hypothetical protein